MKTRVCVFLVVFFLQSAAGQIALNDKEYFEGPGISFLLFHNNYMGGYQGGLQLVQNGERILDTGDLLLTTKRGVANPGHGVVRREVDRAAGTATVFGEIREWNTGYRFVMSTDGKRLTVKLALDKPIDWSKVESAGIRISLFPTTYYSKSYQSVNGAGVFTRHFTGERVLLNAGGRLLVAQEDPLHAVTFEREGGPLLLIDPRDRSVQAWFQVVAPIWEGSAATEVEFSIIPSIRPEWRRPPVIAVSQVGYHPKQPKRAVIEFDGRVEPEGEVRLYRLPPKGGREVAKQAAVKPWGSFHRYNYGIFDFSEVREPGVYLLEFAGQRAGPFQISESVFRQAWMPTLQYFLPTQMCHVKVREGSRIWHGECHLDDAQQAPANTPHLDGYHQGERETKYSNNEHVPGLDWGGWHDAGDHDIPAGSLCNTIEALALAAEEFAPSMDLTSISRDEREVVLHEGDGVDDLLQQIAFGVEWLIAGYKMIGHVPPGVVERTGFQYGTKGDMMNTTDNRVHDPELEPDERRGEYSGKMDDRWVFTNRNTGLQYRTAQTLVISHRVLAKAMPDLAAECLRVARELWQYERERDPVWGRSAYTPRDTGYRAYELAATAELYLTTKEAKYARHLANLRSSIDAAPGDRAGAGPGGILARVLPELEDQGLRDSIRAKMAEWKKASDRRSAASPFGVLYEDGVIDPGHKLESRSHVHSSFVWGHGWRFQKSAMDHYFLHKHLPELFGPEVVLDTVNYVLGCHPATNESFVSSVGAHSTLAAYGFNRADWSHQPGGVISGTSLIKPDLLELKGPFPFLWYQTEIVIGGAGTWIFDALAAEKLANEMR
jgi:hypothetical protein